MIILSFIAACGYLLSDVMTDAIVVERFFFRVCLRVFAVLFAVGGGDDFFSRVNVWVACLRKAAFWDTCSSTVAVHACARPGC